MSRLLRALASFHAQFWQGAGAPAPAPAKPTPAGGGAPPDRRTLRERELALLNALARVRAQSLPLRAQEEHLLRELAWVRARRGDPPRVATRAPLAASVVKAARPRGVRLPGTTRPELARAIAVREQRLAPLVRHAMARVAAVVSPAVLRHAWTIGQLLPTLDHQVRGAWLAAQRPMAAALAGGIRKTSEADLADRQIAALLVDVSERQLAAVRAQLAILMDQGPSAPVLGAIAAAAGLTETQTQAVGRFIAQRLDAEGGNEEAALRAGEQYAGRLQDQRARLIARTEAVRYTASVVLERGRELGGTVVKQWISARDANVDEICRALDNGAQVPLDAPFEAINGLTFDGPPAHPGCRCVPEIWRLD